MSLQSTPVKSPVHIHCAGATAIVQLIGDFGELAVVEFESVIRDSLARFDALPQVKNVVVDLSRSDYCGSSALGLFVSLSQRCQDRGGRFALCGVSQHMREVLQVTGLVQVWTLCESLDEALHVVASHDRR